MWNKLYLIKSTDKGTNVTTERIFRIPLPVNPWFKMQSEVATMEYARLNTSIPIPKVYVFESSMENDLGFEWIIMEKVPGRTFADAQDSMGPREKERLATTIADWVHELSLLQFDVIGSLYRQWDPTKEETYLQFRLGPVTSDYFLGPWRANKPVFKGPFRNEAQLYREVVNLNLEDILDPKQMILAERAWACEEGYEYIDHHNGKDEAVQYHSECSSNSSSKTTTTQSFSTVYSSKESFKHSGVQKACFASLHVLPLVERRLQQAPRKYVLHHFDISKHNVLLNDAGEAVYLLDWENIATESLSQVEPWPSIFDPTRYDPPDPWEESELKPRWYLKAEKNHITRLTGDAFMLQLKKLQSPWPQAHEASAEQIYANGFEEDLAELGSLAKTIYANWAETEICSRIMQKCGDVFLPIVPKVPKVTVEEEHEVRARTSPPWAERFLHRVYSFKATPSRKGDVRKRVSRPDDAWASKKAREI